MGFQKHVDQVPTPDLKYRETKKATLPCKL